MEANMAYQHGDEISFDELQKLFPAAAAAFPDDSRDYTFSLFEPLDNDGDPDNVTIDGQEWSLNADPNSDFDSPLTWLAGEGTWEDISRY